MALTLIYDKECPLCRRYVNLLRLEKAAGPITLLDAREGGATVEAAIKQGYVLDQGMVLIIDERYYHGHEALNLLSLMSSRVGWFNRVNRRLFRSRGFARLIYPAMRAGRRALLTMLGRSPLGY